MIRSYPKIYNLGHANLGPLLDGPVVVQEKLDGSQFSFQWIDGELHARSKGRVQAGAGAVPDGMFQAAIDFLSGIDTADNSPIFRAEVFSKPKHNTLAYERVPKNGLALFDVEEAGTDQAFSASHGFVSSYAELLGIETVRDYTDYLAKLAGVDVLLGSHLSKEVLEALLEDESRLGGELIEGVVIKGYGRFGIDGKTLMGKYVSPKFKERHGRDWGKRNPNRADILADIVEALDTEARYEKAVQHLRDDGLLTGTPADIGPLMKEVKRDTLDEEAAWIAEQLVAHFTPKVERFIGRGLPQWYKDRLASEALDRS